MDWIGSVDMLGRLKMGSGVKIFKSPSGAPYITRCIGGATGAYNVLAQHAIMVQGKHWYATKNALKYRQSVLKIGNFLSILKSVISIFRC
jgi:hypothetical protein